MSRFLADARARLIVRAPLDDADDVVAHVIQDLHILVRVHDARQRAKAVLLLAHDCCHPPFDPMRQEVCMCETATTTTALASTVLETT